MIRRSILSLVLTVLTTITSAAGTPKYVFLMIGDGMGINQAAATERYMAACRGEIGRDTLTFTNFPYTAICHTYSLSNGVTDSSAAGTALSTGSKTANGVLGMDSTRTVALTSIAEKAHRSGRAVGVVTSVSIDHATPGAFYAHVPSRKEYYRIGQQLAASGYEFFGGADFLSPTGKEKNERHLHELLADSGYTIVRDLNTLSTLPRDSKIFLTQPAGRGLKQLAKSRSALPYAIDRTSADLTLPQITAAAIERLDATGHGFFLMVEGGAIDWACHSNDAATAFAEILDFDSAIAEAYRFYLQHPDETLIVVTADHETGGMALGNSNYTLRFHMLQPQQCSLPDLTSAIAEATAEGLTWEHLQAMLAERLGFGTHIKLNAAEEAQLRDAYDRTMAGAADKVHNEYSDDDMIAVTAINILNRKAKCGWTTGAHSGAPVGVYAIGYGAEQFTGVIDNTDIPRKIASIAGYSK